MFGKGVHQEEEGLFRDIIRSINKKIDYTAGEGEGTRFTLHLKVRGHETDVSLDIEHLKLAKNDMDKGQQVRHRITGRYDHLDKARYGENILGLKPAKLLRASPKPEPSTQQRGFSRSPRR